MIQSHPFTPDPLGSGDVCIAGVKQGDTIVHCGQGVEDHEDHTPFARRANPDFDFNKTYYLSGPMAGYEDHNFPAFQAACEALRTTGIKVVSPHENPTPPFFDQLTTQQAWRYMVDSDIELMLEKCEGLILLRGWPSSRGALEEITALLNKGRELDIAVPVWFYHDFQLTQLSRDGV